jgi:hypothetical protein
MINTLIQYYLAFLINTQFNIGTLKLIFIGYIFVIYFLLERKLYLHRYSLVLLLLFFIGFINSLIFIIIDIHAYNDILHVYLRNRAFFTEIFFAIALYLYLREKSIEYTLNILLIGVIANSIIGTAQFFMAPFERISMLFPEPSAAGYYYLFIFFILFEKFKHGWPMLISRYFMFLGLAIGSKAQYVLLLAVGVLHYLSPKRLILFLSVLISLTYLFRSEITSIPAIKYNLYVAEVYMDQGLRGFKTQNRVWDSYSTRMAAIEGSVRCIIQNPLGIGFGSFNSWFRIHMANTGLDNPEINDVLAGKLYASSKSNLLELFVATGIFGIALYFYISSYFYRYRREHGYLFKSFVMMTLASLFIELSPMFIYLTVLWVLLEKERQNDQMEKIS